MRALLSAGLMAVAFFSVDKVEDHSEKAISEANKTLQGKWLIVEVETNGKEHTRGLMRSGAQLIFNDETYLFEFKGEITAEGSWTIVDVKDGNFFLDIQRMSNKGKPPAVPSLLRIVDANTLQWCSPVRPAGSLRDDDYVRPTKLVTSPGSHTTLFTLARVE